MNVANAIETLKAVIPLFHKGSRRAIGFELASIGEVQFFFSVFSEFVKRHPNDIVYIFHHDTTERELELRYQDIYRKAINVPYRLILSPAFKKLDLYITTEQFNPGPPTVFTLTLFHGQPSKGVTFGLPPHDPLLVNDAMFLYGPLHRQALEEYLQYSQRNLPLHLKLYDIGYTKSDALVNGIITRESAIDNYKLDPNKKTVLYAPAFNAGASMRESGVKILQTLCNLKQYNVLAKLAIDCLRPTSDSYATGGTNWFDVIGHLENQFDNFRLVRQLEADQALASADVLVTCVSSISFEFLAIGRPVIFIDVPKFFQSTIPKLVGDRDATQWVNRTTVNGGREFGVVVTDYHDLPKMIGEILHDPDNYLKSKGEVRRRLLYNPGNATHVAVDKIQELLIQGVRSQRPGDQGLRELKARTGYQSLRMRIGTKIRHIFTISPRQIVQRQLLKRGYRVQRTGLDFLDASTTVAAARETGVSVCDYLERLDGSNKVGRRDRIIHTLEVAGVLNGITSVCEIGAGTGRFLEKILAITNPSRYEIYETDRGWVEFLIREYGNHKSCRLICHPSDGVTLNHTPDESCDLVHAHAVFVYLPILQTFGYLKDCARICRKGGHVVFDCFLDKSFAMDDLNQWLAGHHRWPVVIPQALLEEFLFSHHLRLERIFSEVYGDGNVCYMIWKKN